MDQQFTGAFGISGADHLVLAFARRHRWHTLGLGTAVAALAFVPVVNAVFLTTAVAGAVLLRKRINDPSLAGVK